MKECEKCGTSIDDKYRFCFECSNKFKALQDKTPPDKKSVGQWNDDPVVDALLKLNANVGKLTQSLERVERIIDAWCRR